MKTKFVILALAVLTLAACAKPSHQTDNLAREWQPAKVAILPYQLGVVDTKTNRASSPITGATYRAGDITVTAQVVMDQILQDELSKVSSFNLVSRENAGKAFAAHRALGAKRALLQAGRDLGVDAVVIGYVYRFTQRDGTDFGVEAPASAAFDVCVVRVADGQVMWRNSFDHTQTALSDNLLDAGQFVSRGLRWFTVEEFAQYGMEQLLEQFPWRAEEEGK